MLFFVLRRWGMQDDVDKMRTVLMHRPLATNENWGFEADLIAGAVRLIRTKILKACSDKLLILLVFENSGYQSMVKNHLSVFSPLCRFLRNEGRFFVHRATRKNNVGMLCCYDCVLTVLLLR